MVISYLQGVLEISNVFVSIFVLIFAWSFLRQTSDAKDRKPWFYLFIASIVFFIFEILSVLKIFDIYVLPELLGFLNTIFIALILFVFILQYDLILRSDLILITKKIVEEEKKKEEKEDKELKQKIEELKKTNFKKNKKK